MWKGCAGRVWDIRQKVGMVFQNPDNQLVAAVVEEDVAFGPENLGVPPEEIRERVDLALEKVGMTSYRKQAPSMRAEAACSYCRRSCHEARLHCS